MSVNATTNLPAMPSCIAEAIAEYPEAAKVKFKELRGFIFEEAARLKVGPIEESLKWGEPAFLTPISKAGSTIRLAWKQTAPDHVGVYFNCKTDIVAQFKSLFGDTFHYGGTRSVAIPTNMQSNEASLKIGLAMALTYHHRKQTSTSTQLMSIDPSPLRRRKQALSLSVC